MYNYAILNIVTNLSIIDQNSYIPNSLWDLKNIDANVLLSSDRFLGYFNAVKSEDITINTGNI